ncbi:CARDB domain-containing protein [Natrinema salsiterrestre]|uniref:CARDB domain-containing protein n=1 Tax=Natrinema salsiterrestre TaxID=2950540 RepID=A0A9Q4L2U5_9EURY|nr:CARDB domain-containing protein [Natrinema salsiterrestre]MDF9744920.1 hypothetical protein [Natrinema salsiterrestre]
MSSVKTPLVAALLCFLLALVVPTAAITVGEDRTDDDVVLESVDDRYATIDDGELRLDLGVVANTETRFADVFTIAIGDDADDVEAVWIDHDVEGVTFHADGSAVTNDSRLEPDPGDSIRVGVAVDSSVATAGTETFTVAVGYADEDDTSEDGTGGDGTNGGTGDSADDGSSSSATILGSELTLSPTTLETGETLTASATYRNAGDARGTAVATLTVDGTVVDRQRIELRPGEETTVTFERRMDWPGTYAVGIDGVGSESVTVEGPPVAIVDAGVVDDVAIDDSDTTADITVGESTAVRATVRNPTNATVERTLELSVDGIVVESRLVSIPANGERTVSFDRGFDRAGTYEISVSGVTAGTVTVSDRPAPVPMPNRELSAATTAALAPPTTAGLLFLAVAANRKWAFAR